ncbi:MAG: hypothetical protein U0U66_02575 [Cytophagaceae bacterium]
MKNIITSAAIFFGIIIAANASDPMKSVNNYKQMGAANKAKQEMRLAGTQKTNAVNRTATNSTAYKNNFKKYDYAYEMVPAQELTAVKTTNVKVNYKHQF